MGRILILCILASVVGLPSIGFAQFHPAAAKKKAEAVSTVFYSYEKWSRVEPARYVLVPRPTRVKKTSLPERTRSLFRKLVASKSGTYGDTRLAFQKDVDSTKVVYVWLDKAKSQYHPIIMAETVYTFTENGASKVIFPGVKPQGWKRDDVPFSAYVLALPFWQVLPPAELTGAFVQMPDGTLIAAGKAIAALKSGDQKMADALWNYTQSGGAPALAAMKAATFLKVADLADRMLPLLDSADKNIRRAAIEGLRAVDSQTVSSGLRKVVDGDPDPSLRDLAASILAESKNPEFAAAAQYHALRSTNKTVVMAAATALAANTQPEAKAELMKALKNEDQEVRQAVISSLIKRGNEMALVGHLNDSKTENGIRIEIAKALASSKSAKTQHAAFLFLAVNGNGEEAESAARNLGSKGGTGAEKALGSALKHKESTVRVAAAESLGKLGKTSALSLLAQADLTDVDSGDAVRDAIRRIYGAQKLDYVLKATNAKEPILKRSAVSTLGVLVKSGKAKRARKKIIAALRPLSSSKDPEIRAAAVESFGIMGGDDIRDDVYRLSKDKDVLVQRSVAYALGSFPSPETNTLLLKYIASDDAEIIGNAARSIGVLKVSEGLNPVINQLAHPDVYVRRSATRALVSLGRTLKERNPLLSFFSERLFDQDGDVRLIAIEGLRLVKDKRTITAMGALIQDPLMEVRLETLDAMAATGLPSAVNAIAGALEDDSPKIRGAALTALGKLGRKEAIPVLQSHLLKEKDPTVLAAAKSSLAKLK